jgi:hypothetical protein
MVIRGLSWGIGCGFCYSQLDVDCGELVRMGGFSMGGWRVSGKRGLVVVRSEWVESLLLDCVIVGKGFPQLCILSWNLCSFRNIISMIEGIRQHID